MKENQTVEYPQRTAGIVRNMQAPPLNRTAAGIVYPGGGDMNGTAAFIMLGHSGTGLGPSAMPRLRSRFRGA